MRHSVLFLCLAGVASVIAILALALPTLAAPVELSSNAQLYVSTLGNDANPCTSGAVCQTIGRAVNVAVAGSATVSTTINIAAGSYGENLVIGKYIILQGPTSGSPAIVDGGGLDTVIVVTKTQVSINNLTIRNGAVGGAPSVGGGIVVSGSGLPTVFVRNSVIRANTGAQGGGIYNNNGEIFIVRSSIEENTSTASGGGVASGAGSITNIATSAVISNTAATSGGGISNAGALVVVNSTIAHNTATGGASTGGGIDNTASGSAGLNNLTIVFNTASTGGGVSNAGTVNVQNTIIARNTGTDPDCSGTLTSGGYNLLGSITGCTGITNGVSGDQVNGAPGLAAALALNGGFTLNYNLQAGSPAIDHGNPGGCTDGSGNTLTFDQRGTVRPQGPACDVGAVENGSAPVLGQILPDQTTAGSAGFTMTLTGAGFSLTNARVLWTRGSTTTTLTPATFSATQLTVNIPASLILTAGSINVAVQNQGSPAPNTSPALPFTVNLASQTITFAPIADRGRFDGSFNVTATASSGLAVNFTATGPCSLSGNTVSLTGVGLCTITAHQGGNATYAAAPDVPQSFNINTETMNIFLPVIGK